jgi:hypothetical protein
MNPRMPEPTPAPIHDIVAPVPFLPYPMWVLVVAGLAIIAVLGLAVWFFFLRKRPGVELSARERTLRAIEALRERVESEEPYAFGIEVSDVLRRYIHEQHGLQAPTQTSIEFLESIRSRGVFSEDERTALARFLEKADLIKFARLHATAEDSRDLLATAEALVLSGERRETEEAAA